MANLGEPPTRVGGWLVLTGAGLVSVRTFKVPQGRQTPPPGGGGLPTIGFCLGEPGAGAPGPLVLTENKSTTGRREKDSGFCLRRAVRGSARVLAVAGDWPGSAEDSLFLCAVWGCGALNLWRRFVELTLPQAKEYNPYRVEIEPTHTLPMREGLFVPFCVFVSRSPGGAGRVC